MHGRGHWACLLAWQTALHACPLIACLPIKPCQRRYFKQSRACVKRGVEHVLDVVCPSVDGLFYRSEVTPVAVKGVAVAEHGRHFVVDEPSAGVQFVA